MAKALTIAATIAGAAAFAIVTAGAGAALLGGVSLAAGVASVGAAVGITASTLSLVAGGLTLAAGLLNSTKAQKPGTTVSAEKQAIPARVRAFGRLRLHPYFALFETASDGSAVDVYAFADVPSDGNELIYINDDKVTVSGETVNALPDKKYQNGLVSLGFTKGAYPNSAFASVMAKIPSWTTNHRGDGVCTGFLIKRPEKEKYFTETYPQGDNTDVSRVDRWGYQYDPRDPSQNIADNPRLASMWSGGSYIGSWKWTENPVLHLLWYLVWDRGYSYDAHILPTVEYWKTAANVCDEPVTKRDGTTEPRYRSCVAYTATALEKEVFGSLSQTFDGWMQERGDGAFVIYAGKVYTPTVFIGPDDIISSSLQNFVETENSIDQVKVTYISAEHDYTEVETTPWVGENGAQRVGTLDPATPSFSQNRRLAKRLMDRTNSPQRGTITTGLSGRKVRAQRYIHLDHSEGDITFFAGIVEITKVSRNFGSAGLDFDWIAVDPNIDSWNPATEEGEPAAVGDRVAPEPLAAPAIVSIVTTNTQNTGYGVPGVKLTITAQGPANRDDLTWYVRTRLHGATSWLEQSYSDTDPGTSVVLQTDFLPVGMLDVEVSYGTGNGQISPWATLGTTPIDTGTQLPDMIKNLSVSVSATGDLIVADWDDTPFATKYRVEVIVGT